MEDITEICDGRHIPNVFSDSALGTESHRVKAKTQHSGPDRERRNGSATQITDMM
jgi:hypothetical protein